MVLGHPAGEIVALYAAYLGARRSPLPELAVQYADYAPWQRRWLRGRVWTIAARLLEGSSSTARPRCSSCPRIARVPRCRATRATLACSHPIPRAPAWSWRSWPGAEGATPFMVLLAAFSAAAAHACPDRRTSWSARPSRAVIAREVEGLIGFFVNTLVLRTA